MKTPDQSNKNVCTEIVSHNLCIGCGVCAGICPSGNLKIRFNEYGEYNAYDVEKRCSGKCDLCLRACPFSNLGEDEDKLGKKLFAQEPGILYRPETGFYMQAFLGSSMVNGHRENGASGGMATWMLETLLSRDLVDHVCCVSPMKGPEKPFDFVICRTVEEIRRCSKSCYYPVEASGIVKYILSHEGRYAIIGLPCLMKAVHKAMEVNGKLRNRVKYLLGLTCSQMKSRCFSEYAAASIGGNPNNINEIRFRIKSADRNPRDFGVSFVTDEGTPTEFRGIVTWWQGPCFKFRDGYFGLPGCKFCTDVFAELSDVVFMDAWHPKYGDDPKGNSIVISRRNEISDLIQTARGKNELELIDLPIDEAILSMRNLVRYKREGIGEKIKVARKEGRMIPVLRQYSLPRLSFWEKNRIRCSWDIARISREKWLETGKCVDRFNIMMRPYERKAHLVRALQKVPGYPFRLAGRIWKRLLG